ncbi:sugar phosphate exchanger 3 [Petromyzon marinus]|uniref:Sugar phosphate exchanger 3 n=1 Tax=Petromyzon marinus TaxID=7757 RepID=A0AAJ7U214_PETMA|nr:sugar phosphate exchanger 3-like [Petromyzon marinus]XP_032828387.1 sugar phosphate exchanger 3-like [Petromyzon marinus]XP_032828388.1 sugar phosphate exchanger 3-like [Petromyzon marinus]
MLAPEAPRRGWTHHHFCVFLLTFFSYAFFHVTRKTFSNVKVSLSVQWTGTPTNESTGTLYPPEVWSAHQLFPDENNASLFLGALDTIFLFSYAVGLYISGYLGDRFNLRLVLTLGMCSSAIVVLVFGSVTEWLGFYSMPFYAVMWAVNGLLQSTGWPCVVAIMGNWFGKDSRGLVFGLWSACASVGNILGALLVSGVLRFGYEYAFLVTACCLFASGIVVFFGLVSSPLEVGLPAPDCAEDGAGESVNCAEAVEQTTLLGDPVSPPPALGFFQAVCLPGVALYSLAYACLKLVNYSFFFWLPFYLSGHFGWSEADADRMSIWYDVGGIIGGAAGGLVSDRLGKRAPIITLMLILATGSLVGYKYSPNNKSVNGFLMGVTGFFVGGPANLISSAVSADLGRQGPVQGNQEALATVTGIVDGTGSLGASVGQFLVAVIKNKLGWGWVFYLFILMTLLTIVCLLPLVIREVRELVASSRVRRTTQQQQQQQRRDC